MGGSGPPRNKRKEEGSALMSLRGPEKRALPAPADGLRPAGRRPARAGPAASAELTRFLRWNANKSYEFYRTPYKSSPKHGNPLNIIEIQPEAWKSIEYHIIRARSMKTHRIS